MNATAQIVDIVRIHELTLPVIRFNGVDYVEAKRVSDYLGIDWRSAKRTLKCADNACLYGVARVPSPTPMGRFGPRAVEEGILCMRLDRVRLYILRVNISQLREKGNHAAANRVVEKIKEWGSVMQSYEATGSAFDKEKLRELDTLNKIRNATTCTAERASLTALIRQIYEEMGVPVPLEA